MKQNLNHTGTEARKELQNEMAGVNDPVQSATGEAPAAGLRDDRFLSSRTDEIDNATWAAICMLAHIDGDEDVEEQVDDLSMELVGEVNAFIEELLKEHGIPTCYPYHENDVICYKTADRCKHCSK